MTLEEIVENYAGWVAIGIGILLSCIEFSKIKINPWSMIFGWIGDKLLSGMKKELAEVKTKVSGVETALTTVKSELKSDIAGVKSDLGELRDEHRQDEALAARTRILRFADEVYQQEKHSKEYFDEILRDITAYKHYCDTHKNFENEQAVHAIARIEKVYDACLESGTFL